MRERIREIVADADHLQNLKDEHDRLTNLINTLEAK